MPSERELVSTSIADRYTGPLLLDLYSSLGYKSGLDTGRSPYLAPSWTSTHTRRLTAYKILEAYFRNRARDFLAGPDADRNARREYGDAALLVRTVVQALLGDDISLTVDGAGENVSGSESPEQRAANARLEWLNEWADTERFRNDLYDAERNAVKLGDAVYTLAWSDAKQRVRLEAYDPGFYFPELKTRSHKDFPRRVDIAWEEEREVIDGRGNLQTETWVHRITWKLVDDGVYVYPWGTSTTRCLKTEGDWRLDEIGPRTVHMDWPRGVYVRNADGQEIRDLDLGIDFLPVIHVPNTVSGAEHFGESILTSVAQLLDELAAADTDKAKAAALACVPMIGAAGKGRVGTLTVEPGAILELGEGGRMDVLDMSAALKTAMDYANELRELLSQNVRVPSEVLGRVKASEIAAGIIMALSFGPMRGLIDEMRLVRSEKYPLLLKFVQRLARVAGALDGEELRAEVAFGNFIPADESALVDLLLKLWNAKVLSRETVITILVEKGVVETDVAEELARCRSEDFAAALTLLNATDGDRDPVYEMLGLGEPPEKPEPPEIIQRVPGQPSSEAVPEDEE